MAGGCHAIDAIRWFMQSDVIEVTAYSSKSRNDLKFDGTITVLLKFDVFPLTEVQQAYWLGRSGVFELSDVSTHNYFEIKELLLHLSVRKL